MHSCPYDDCTGNCINTRQDLVTTNHRLTSLLYTYDPHADPATVHSAANRAIELLEQAKKGRENPFRQWTPSPVPLSRGQGTLESLQRMLHYRQLLTL